MPLQLQAGVQIIISSHSKSCIDKKAELAEYHRFAWSNKIRYEELREDVT